MYLLYSIINTQLCIILYIIPVHIYCTHVYINNGLWQCSMNYWFRLQPCTPHGHQPIHGGHTLADSDRFSSAVDVAVPSTSDLKQAFIQSSSLQHSTCGGDGGCVVKWLHVHLVPQCPCLSPIHQPSSDADPSSSEVPLRMKITLTACTTHM